MILIYNLFKKFPSHHLEKTFDWKKKHLKKKKFRHAKVQETVNFLIAAVLAFFKQF